MTSPREDRARKKARLEREFIEATIGDDLETHKAIIAAVFLAEDPEFQKQLIANEFHHASIVAAWMADQDAPPLSLTDELLLWCSENSEALQAYGDEQNQALVASLGGTSAASQGLRVSAWFRAFDPDARNRRRAQIIREGLVASNGHPDYCLCKRCNCTDCGDD